MLSNTAIVMFGEDWHGLPSSTIHLAKEFAKTHKIIWINSIGLRQPRFSTKDAIRIIKKGVSKFVNPLTPHSRTMDAQQHHNIHICNILTWPAPRSRFMRALCAHIIARQVNRHLKAQHVKRPILWTSLPTAADALTEIDHHSIVYYCCDDFSSLAGVDHHTVTDHEMKLGTIADTIIVSQPQLKSKFNTTKVKWIPHGVDFELFSVPQKRAPELPQNRPIVGYYGSIETWLDLDFIAHLASELPNHNFVMIGHIACDISLLQNHKNVHFLGAKPHNLLPSYSQHWDFALLPFLATSQIQFCNPLKLREYLAAGCHVISTDFPAARDYSDVITIANTKSAAVKTIKNGAHSHHNRHACKERVRIESWSHRAKQALNWIGI